MHSSSYLEKSLELHLFFARIMKEHSLFLRAGFTPVDSSFANKAEFFKNEFESLLFQAVILSDNIVSYRVLNSGEIVTEFTAMAEIQTEHFTGIKINKEITQMELNLQSGYGNYKNTELNWQVKMLNETSIKLLDGLISFKEDILNKVLNCTMFTMNYPLLLEHILREAKLYRTYILNLEKYGELKDSSMKETECFWNQIMMEHALFIRGLLDPTENELIESADGFAQDYARLLESCQNVHNSTFANPYGIAEDSLAETLKFRDFKMAGTKGIQQCEVRSIILPLLADHVLREANHYVRLLRD